ncbi:type III secretion system stator protein SctL [Terrihabitans sp. B22-R8]|uniref:type III secretion system stator protein SctL n=1 Tax=Terrihabitans sp. B22-R8 TaxID=3425128 RepID=UPI00403CAA66
MTAESGLEHSPPPPQLRPLGPIVRAEDAGLWHEAAEALEAAHRHLARVRNWAGPAFAKERRRGYADGYEAGAGEAARLVAQVSARMAAQKGSLESVLPALVMEIVEDLLGNLDAEDILIRTVRHAVDRKFSGSNLRLRASPARLERLSREFEAYDGRGGRPLVQVEADPALAPDQCVMWSEYGNIDLGVEAQMRALRLGFGLPARADAQT